MHILVAVKQIIDPCTSGSAKENAKINPYDAVALEAALQLFDKGYATKITVVSISKFSSKNILLECLAKGANKAYQILTPCNYSSLSNAKILASFAKRVEYDLIFCGAKAVDTDAGQTGSMLAGLLRVPYLGNVISVDFSDSKVDVVSDYGDRFLRLSAELPLVVSVSLQLNSPRVININALSGLSSDSLNVIPVEDLIDLNVINEDSILCRKKDSSKDCKFISPLELSEIIRSESRSL